MPVAVEYLVRTDDIGVAERTDTVGWKVLVERKDACRCVDGVECKSCRVWRERNNERKRVVAVVSDLEEAREEVKLLVLEAVDAGLYHKAKLLRYRVAYLTRRLKLVAEVTELEQYDRTVEDTASALV